MDESGQEVGKGRRFKVGEWLVQPQLRELVSPDGKETVEARSMDVLVALAEAAGEVLSRSELLERGWGELFVGEEVLSHAIWDLRRALGDEPKTPRFIQTVHGKGYRLVAKVSWLQDGVGEQARYVLEEEIGRGAMGVVWRARDPRLERDVALKFLAPELRLDRDAEARFLREARADARLDHPNICAVHEVDETDDGRMYLVMPLYSGPTLRERIDEGPLPWREAVLIASQIAAGLGAAHEAGIVHRDLKPSNVMLTPAPNGTGGAEGATVVKILDFGLAKLRGMSRLTVAGSSLGTPSYMSPEMASQQDAGPESDLWALGVLLYEMLVGHCPFRGANAWAVLHTILTLDPEPLPETLDLPFEFRELIFSLLRKTPEDRPSDAAEVATALTGLLDGSVPPVWQTTAVISPPVPHAPKKFRFAATVIPIAAIAAIAALGLLMLARQPAETRSENPEMEVSKTHSGVSDSVPDPLSIVVLPFANRSGDREQEYFSDGISEELLSLLTRIPALSVTSRTSAFSFKGQSLRAPEIARRLNVANVLEGSVRRNGDQVRITAQLIDAVSDTTRWSETYHRTFGDIFAIQDEIAADVAKQLSVQLLDDPPTVEKTDPVAYELILQARRFAWRGSADGYKAAIDLLERAVSIDSNSASAWAELAEVYLFQTGEGERDITEGIHLAREAVNRALAIDPDHVVAQLNLGSIARGYDLDLPTAARYTSRALRLEPHSERALGSAGLLAVVLGRLDEAIDMLEFLVARDPLNSDYQFQLGVSYYLAGRFEEAADSNRYSVALAPEAMGGYYNLALSLLLQGEASAALDELRKEPNEGFRWSGLALAYHAAGRPADSDAALAEMIEKYEKDAAYNIAAVLAFRGEADRAFTWLDKAVEYRDGGLQMIGEPLFNSIHDDPRWLPFLRRIGRAPEQLAAIEFDVPVPE